MKNNKNIKNILSVFQQVIGEGFQFKEVEIQKEYEDRDNNKSTITIKVLSILGGFLATLFFVAFLLMLGVYDSEFGLIILGSLLIISSIWLNKSHDKLILDTFSISMYAIGFVLLGFGFDIGIDENIVSVMFILIALSCLFITQNYMISFISILIINGGFLTLINLNDSFNLVHLFIVINTLFLVYWMLNEARIITMGNKIPKLYNPIRIGLLVSLLFAFMLIGNKHIIPELQNYPWISSTVQIIAVLYLVNKILEVLNIESLKQRFYIFTSSILILISTIFSPAITGTIMILLLCFLVNYKTGFTIGVVSLAYFISQFYYDLSFTLLTKSIILFSSGIVFILLYLFTRKKLHVDEKI